MKTLIILVVLLTGNAFADLKSQEYPVQLKDRIELSPAFTFTSMKEKGSGGQWYATLPVRLTYFVSKSVGIGGELIFTDYEGDGNTGIIASFLLEGDFASTQGTILYALGGYGVSNSSMVLDRLAIRYSDNAKIWGVLSLGFGAKIPIINGVLGKIEFRYQNFSGKYSWEDYMGETYTDKIRINYLNIMFGISILL
jgi:hypothetical protein